MFASARGAHPHIRRGFPCLLGHNQSGNILSLHPLKVNGLFFFSSYVPVPTILFLPSFVFDNCEVFFFLKII